MSAMTCTVCERGQVQPFRAIGRQAYHRCPVCQATLMAPESRLDADAEQAVYALHDNAVDDPGYRAFLRRLADPLCEQLSPGAVGLDFGCGPGPALARMLETDGFSMRLYDPFFHRDDAALATTYDFITCTEVVEHLHRPAEVFRTLHDLLRPGGWLGIMTCFQTDDDRFDQWHYRRDPTHVVFYREATFHWLAAAWGWHLEIPRKDVVLMRKPVAQGAAGHAGNVPG